MIVRWDGDDVSKLEFPQSGSLGPDRSAAAQGPDTSGGVAQLLAHGKPATFGHNGRDVLDESYRKAIKLDSTEFSTNFHPHDYGISLLEKPR